MSVAYLFKKFLTAHKHVSTCTDISGICFYRNQSVFIHFFGLFLYFLKASKNQKFPGGIERRKWLEMDLERIKIVFRREILGFLEILEILVNVAVFNIDQCSI